MINKKILFVLLTLSIVFLSGCTTSINEIKENSDDYKGETVTVRGEVSNVIKLGKLSGFTLEDDSGSIIISSDELPAEGKTVTVKGVVMKELFIGTYIEAKNLR